MNQQPQVQIQSSKKGFSYVPRSQFLSYHQRTQRYACIIAHRRAGKSYGLLNDIIVRALTPRQDGLRQQFALMAPTQSQARSIAWAYIKEQTACFATCGGYKALEQHLTITLPNPNNTNEPGSTIMLVGSENAERLRGLFLDGIVIDEAADIPDFVVTQIIRPALADRQGWLTISGTVKSIDDYLWRTFEISQKAPRVWFSMNLKASESGILPKEELDDLRRSMTEEQYQIEFENNVQAAVTGRILLPYMNHMQVTRVPYDPAGGAPFSGWDLGISDAMAVWVAQQVGREVRILDYTEESGKGMDHFVDWLRKRTYSARFGAHLLPHDTKVRELGNGGKSRLQALREMGMRNIKIVQRLPKYQQIDAGRMLLPRCWFNEDTTEVGRRALRNYSFEFDPHRKVFSRAPLHNAYSNGSDAFLNLAVGLRKATGEMGDDGGGMMGGGMEDDAPMQDAYEMDSGI